MVIELLLFLVLVVVLASLFKIKEHFNQTGGGMAFLLDQLTDVPMKTVLSSRFEDFNYADSNGSTDDFENMLYNIYYTNNRPNQIVIIAKAPWKYALSNPEFLAELPFERSYRKGDVRPRVVLIIEKSKVTPDNLKEFVKQLAGFDPLQKIVDGNLTVKGSVNASSYMVNSQDLVAMINNSVNAANNKPCFSYYNSQQVPVPSDDIVFKVVPFDTKEFDTHNYFSANAYRPKMSGYYQVNWSVILGGYGYGEGGNKEVFSILYNNGKPVVWGTNYATTVDHWICTNGSALVEMNGTTDNLYIAIVQKTRTGAYIIAHSDGWYARFSGFLVRSL